MGRPDSAIPSWIRKWLMINTAILVYDGSFCVLRPYSLGDGWLGTLYYGYRYYIMVDAHYGDVKDTFIWTQGLGNIVESVLYCMVIFNCLENIRLTKLLCIMVNTMTMWKTFLFFVYSLDPLGGPTVHRWPLEIFSVFIPTAVFFIVPLYVVYVLVQDFTPTSSSLKTSEKNIKSSSESSEPKRRYYLRNNKAS